MSKILYGKDVRDREAAKLKAEVSRFTDTVTLAIVQVGNRADSDAYVRNKTIFGRKIGVQVRLISLPEDVEEVETMKAIRDLNIDPAVHGIILQLPVPMTLDKDALIDSIDIEKDVDGMSAVNLKRLWEGRDDAVVPATTRGIIELLDEHDIEIEGKKVTIVGRSSLVGKPTALAMLNRNATVTICHSKTVNLERETKEADILVVAAGTPGLITRDFVKRGQVVIDVGITSVETADEMLPKLTGDVVYGEVKDIVAAITPVPGGAGPMTVLSLFRNLLDAYKRHHG